MDDVFTLAVAYEGNDREFEGRLLQLGYLHKIEMDVEGTKVLFEPDEERNYRALVSMEEVEKSKLSVGLLEAIAKQLESLLTK